jgi:S1-C subfamily serine protease|tara:strand:+ start:191 stop:868 length:678 start_codon:yes stop_codon:yes gene_type:complete
MLKAIGGLILLGLFLVFLIFNTPVTQLGSGFLIGDGQYVFTYYKLVKKAKVLSVKFPNEDDIEANLLFVDPAHNLALLKLKQVPKVKALPLILSANGMSPKNESVFTLGYPWTNTMEDLHVLKEGSTLADTASVLIKLKMDLDPIHSGSPLFNTNQEVVGMVLLGEHAESGFPVKASQHFAIPGMWLDKALNAANIENNARPVQNLAREAFIIKSRNNIVLIEAR